MAFRGIGDAATQVIKDQNQLGMEAAQLSETARQFDERLSEQKASRAEAAGQFAQTQASADAKSAEQSRQFEITGLQREGDAREQSRQFEASRADALAKREQEYTLDSFKADLDASMNESTLADADLSRRERTAQLSQYMTAADEEARKRENRKKLAKGAIGALVLSGLKNNWVFPASAIALANKEIGDANTQIVGGGIDPETRTAFLNVKGADGNVTPQYIDPAVQYSVIQEEHGDGPATAFLNFTKSNANAYSAIERAKAAADVRRAEGERKAAASKQSERLRMSESFNKSADREEKLATTDYANKDAHLAKAETYRKNAGILTDAMLREQTGADAPKAFSDLKDGDAVPTEVIKSAGINPAAKIWTDPKTGEKYARWRQGGNYVGRKLSEGGEDKATDTKTVKQETVSSPFATTLNGPEDMISPEADSLTAK